MEHVSFCRPLLEAYPLLRYDHIGVVSDGYSDILPPLPGNGGDWKERWNALGEEQRRLLRLRAEEAGLVLSRAVDQWLRGWLAGKPAAK